MSRAIRLGIFIFVGLMAFALGVFLIGRKEFLFSSKYQLSSSFDNVAGLANGAPVRVGGVTVGTVDHVSFSNTPKGKVLVIMNLKNETRDIVRKDSVALILTEGLLGDKFVAITFGSKNAPPVQDGDSISSQPPVDLSDLIQKSGDVLETTRATLKNLEDASGHFKIISSKIDNGQGTMGKLINDRSVYNNLNHTVSEARAGVTSFQENMEALKGNFFIRGFFKKRGYADSSELTRNEVPKLPSKPAAQIFTCFAKDLFDKPNNADLKNKKLLNKAGEFLQQNPYRLVAVTAKTNFQGEKDKNLELSRAQAMVVRNYLVQNFKIDDTLVKTKGLGEDEQTNSDQGAKVQILIYE